MGGTSSSSSCRTRSSSKKTVANTNWVRLNVGGKTFQTTKNTLSKYPESFLARLVNGELQSEKDESGAYLIDGNPEHFNTILNYIRRGVLNFDGNEKTAKDLLSEADFYKIVPLVDEIRKAMVAMNNRCEVISASREPASSKINGSTVYGYLLLSEKQVDEIRKAMGALNNRCEIIIVSKAMGSAKIYGSTVYGYLLLSENHEDYEVLQALQQKIAIRSRNNNGHYQHFITSDDDETWMNIELILRCFGFVKELNDDMYSRRYNHGHWKFVRTIPE